MRLAPVSEEQPARTLIAADGEVVEHASRQDVAERLAAGKFFWLDLPGLGEEESSWLRDLFGFHPLAIEDTEHLRQRPKFDDYDDYVFLVLYGSGSFRPGPEGALIDGAPSCTPEYVEKLSEVHCFVAEKYLVTIHPEDCPAFADLADRMRHGRAAGRAPGQLFYRVADVLVDSFFPVLSSLDDRIDDLQAEIMSRPTNDQLRSLLQYKSSLMALRRVITPQRDVFASLASGATALPGLDDEAQRYFRDIYDHLIRLSDLVDSYRDLLSSTTDAYLSVVSNQLNQVMKQLTIIASIFLPLSFLTGFFGQNYAWMVSHLTGLGTFIVLGVGSEVVAVVGLLTLFRRRGWLGNPT